MKSAEKPPSFLAVDLGAESGRAIEGTLKDGVLSMRELHRFPTGVMRLGESSRWNVYGMIEEIRRGLAACGSRQRPESVGVDTWGVDFALLDEGGEMIGLPYSYRDGRTEGAMESFFEKVPRERVFALTGIQFLPFNTLFQLESAARTGSRAMKRAKRLLFMPDFFHNILCGSDRTEFTIATTSQLWNPLTMRWEAELFEALGLKTSIMQETVMPGTMLDGLDDEAADAAGMAGVPVVAVATHDTASAVAAVPAEGRDWAYISSGTWSLMGVEADAPLTGGEAMRLNFTSEGGVEGRWRVLRNITGLWLLQECRRAWDPGGKIDYGVLTDSAREAPAFRSLVDPDDPSFSSPADMPAAIAAFCKKTGQKAPRDRAEFVRCILESLALKYRHVLGLIRRINPRPINRVHVVGGGSRNALLCQFTADATGLKVFAGPAEATAAGNILVQAMACDRVRGLDGIREASRRSFKRVLYPPRDAAAWEKAYRRFVEICG